ncbi:MAG: methyltransferase domain-containing protein [Myxococcota bacterium]
MPAYVALERWAATRRVVVVAPTDSVGPRRLLDAGARGVIVVGGELPPIPGTERYQGVPTLPVGDATIDMVLCVEAYATLAPEPRRQLLREAYRVLRPGGLFASWIRHPPGPDDQIDFWTLEEELGTVFERTYMMAQMPWRGFSLAPVLDVEQTSAPALTLDEGLLDEPPEASHYLAVSFRQRPSAKLIERLTAECLLVPLPDPEVEPEPKPEPEPAANQEADVDVVSTQPITTVPREVLLIATAEKNTLKKQLDELKAREAELAERLETSNAEVIQARADAAALERNLNAQRASAEAESHAKVESLEQRLGEQLEAARATAKAERSRARALQEDLGQRIKALQTEVSQTRQRAQALDQGLEQRVAVLHEQAEQARERADVLQSSLAEAQDLDLPGQLDALRGELGDAQAAYQDAQGQVDELEEQLRTKATDLTVLTATVKDLEQSLARMSERVEARARELETQATARAELQQRYDHLAEERDGLTHQIEVAIAEREGVRQLAERSEAELEQARRRYAEQQELLAEKSQEASRFSGELQVLRERLQHQEEMLDQSRSRTEELTATAAKGHEQGRMLAEVARDRDQLREELKRRAAEIDTLEERLWTTREEVQKERLDGVRLSGEIERAREQAERAREAEQARNQELEQLGGELRRLEVAKAEAQGLQHSREEEIARLRRDMETMSTESADIASLRADLQSRSREIADLTGKLEQARVREQDAVAQAKRRETQLSDAGAELERMRRSTDEMNGVSASLQSELDVKSLEAEQLAASVADLQRQLEEVRGDRRKSASSTEQLQRRLELEAAEQEALRRRLRAREQELEDVVNTNESSGVELYKLRRELEAAAQANEALEEALKLQPGVEEGPTLLQEQQWPEEAISEIRRLKRMMAERTRQHAEQLARVDVMADAAEGGADLDGQRARNLEREVQVRAEEQEHILGLLESAEQKIWEMTDASDRNAARLAASLAQLEKHKEQIDELHDELEVGRNLLAAAQARSLEQERMLASERHKLARAGIGADGLPPTVRNNDPGKEVDDLFAELEMGEGGNSMVDLEPPRKKPVVKPPPPPRPVPEAGAPRMQIGDQTGTMSSPGKPASRSSSRMVIEPMEGEVDWPEPPAQLEEVGHGPEQQSGAHKRPSAPRVTVSLVPDDESKN